MKHALLLACFCVSCLAGVYDYSFDDGSGRALRINVLDSTPVVRGIIIYGNGAGGDARSAAQDAELVAVAQDLGFAVMGTGYLGNFGDNTELTLFEQGLQRFAAQSGHPELINVPWLPMGHSNGGQMSYGLNALRPEKVIAFAATKGGFYNVIRPSTNALLTPGVLVAGQIDADYRRIAIEDLFDGNRPRGALWSWVQEENAAHETGDTLELLRPFAVEMVAARYPADITIQSGTVVLKTMDLQAGWLTEKNSYRQGLAQISAYAEYPGDRSTAGWLPNARLAYAFRAFASYTKACSAVTEPVSGGVVDVGTLVRYRLGVISGDWTEVQLFEGDQLQKRVTRASGAELNLEYQAAKQGYLLFNALVIYADGTRKVAPLRRLYVRAAPKVTCSPAYQNISGGSRAEFASVTTISSVTGWQWYRDGVAIPGATGATLVIPRVQLGDIGTYCVEAARVSGNIRSNDSVLAVRLPLAGSYSGMLSNGNAWTLHVDAKGRATFLAVLDPLSQIVFQRDVLLADDGSFRFGQEGSSGNEQGAYQGIVEGRIASGRVTGGLPALGLSFSGQSVVVQSGLFSGYSRAVSKTTGTDRLVHLVSCGDGSLLLTLQTGGRAYSAKGSIDASGVITLQGSSPSFTGRVTDAGQLEGIVSASEVLPGEVGAPNAEKPGRLLGIAARSAAGAGDRSLIVGVSVGGSKEKLLLLRSLGPTLKWLGVEAVMPNPSMQLYGAQGLAGENDDWWTDSFATQIAGLASRLSLFPMTGDSLDASLVRRLKPGGYSFIVSGAPEGSVTLAEIYDGDENAEAEEELNGLSARANAGIGDRTLIAGLVIKGDLPLNVLIRASGPALARQGVAGAHPDPKLRLFRDQAELATNENWEDNGGSSAIAVATRRLKLTEFQSGSTDAAMLANLAPGSYSVHVLGKDNTDGIALLEVYRLNP